MEITITKEEKALYTVLAFISAGTGDNAFFDDFKESVLIEKGQEYPDRVFIISSNGVRMHCAAIYDGAVKAICPGLLEHETWDCKVRAGKAVLSSREVAYKKWRCVVPEQVIAGAMPTGYDLLGKDYAINGKELSSISYALAKAGICINHAFLQDMTKPFGKIEADVFQERNKPEGRVLFKHKGYSMGMDIRLLCLCAVIMPMRTQYVSLLSRTETAESE